MPPRRRMEDVDILNSDKDELRDFKGDNREGIPRDRIKRRLSKETGPKGLDRFMYSHHRALTSLGCEVFVVALQA